MKSVVTILLLFFANLVFSQVNSVSMTSVDEVTSHEGLAKFITIKDSTDKQRVLSIFKWITDNIAYNVKSFQSNNNRYDYLLDEDDDDDTSSVLKPLDERVANIVLKRRTAVCDGYARLFKTLCNDVGIPCEVITGYARGSMNRVGVQFRCNHKWNAVFVDSAWHLVDATWASGYIDYRNEFEREYNPYYFFTKPEDFLIDHYPEDIKWTLLPDLPVVKEFYNTPFKTAAFSRNYIQSFKPESGVIEAAVGDSIVFELQNNRPKKSLWVVDIPYADSNAITVMECCGISKPENIINGNKISYTYKVKSDKVEWLNVIYDDELIMRYKLNIKKGLPESPPIKVDAKSLH
jgi:transglutaminase/protease-like cytokinesis protein 3